MLRRVVLFTALLCGVVAMGTAQALPNLQLYIEGATYDSGTETWVTTSDNFKLWVIGDADAGAGILDVSLTAAYLTGESGTITLTSTTTGGFGGFTDPSTPVAPSVTILASADGAVPVLGDGSSLPTHGIFGPGTSFRQWSLGDFTLLDSPLGDFQTTVPSPSGTKFGQINAYDVAVTGFSQLHFDAFDHIEGSTHSSFAPFSHDAGTSVPEPTTLLLFGGGLMGLVASRFVRKK